VPDAPARGRAGRGFHAAPGMACLVRRDLMADTIPPALLTGIARAVVIIRAWNARMTQARTLEGGVPPPGRYQVMGRRRLRMQRDQALQTLDRLETQAQAWGIPLEALYAACGGKPVVEPESPPAPPAPASAPAPPGRFPWLMPSGEDGPW
jgi:hypothetical protein